MSYKNNYKDNYRDKNKDNYKNKDNKTEENKENFNKAKNYNQEFKAAPTNKNKMILPKDSVLINKIKFNEKFYEKFKKKLSVALQKYQSSRKTKIVHKLIENDNFDIGIFSGNSSNDIGKIVHSENKLHIIYLNALLFADYVGDNIVTYFNKIIKITEKIDEEKEIISDQRIYNLNKLNKEYDEWMEKFIDAFDYTKLIDGLYYMFLYFLFFRVYERNIQKTNKFLAMNSDYLSKILIKGLKKVGRSTDQVIEKKLKVISDYFILVYYFGVNQNIALKKIEKAYDQSAAEFLRKSNHLKCNDFDDLAYILTETDTLKIQTNIFNMLFKKEFGELGYELIKKSKATCDSFLCSINHKNILFNSFSIDEKISFAIEEEVLNEQSKIVTPKQIKKFL